MQRTLMMKRNCHLRLRVLRLRGRRDMNVERSAKM
jgi:hypothetical protein